MARLLFVPASAMFLGAMAAFIGCHGPDQRGNSRPGVRALQQQDLGLNGGGEEITSDRQVLATTHLAAGHLFEQQQQRDKAVWQYRLAIERDPKLADAYNRLGICLDQMGQFEQADPVFRKAVQLEPQSAYLKNNLGFNLMLRGRWIEAEQVLRSSLQLKPDYHRARINLGVVLGKQARFDEAFAQFRPVVGDALAYYNLGLMYKSGRLYPQSTAAFTRALELEPRLIRARDQLAELGVASAQEVIVAERSSAVEQVAPLSDPSMAPTEAGQRLLAVVENTPTVEQISPSLPSAGPQDEGLPGESPESGAASLAEIGAEGDDHFAVTDATEEVTPKPPTSQPILLDNEPCEARAVTQLLDYLFREMELCREEDFVDQFVFRSSQVDDSHPITVAPAEQEPSSSAALAANPADDSRAPAPAIQFDVTQQGHADWPWARGEINLSEVQGFRLPDVTHRTAGAP